MLNLTRMINHYWGKTLINFKRAYIFASFDFITLSNTYRALLHLILENGHSRIPIYHEQPRNIIGLILVTGGRFTSAIFFFINVSYISDSAKTHDVYRQTVIMSI